MQRAHLYSDTLRAQSEQPPCCFENVFPFELSVAVYVRKGVGMKA